MKAGAIMQRRIKSSGLSATSPRPPDEVVRWHGAMQAQDYGPAKWSINQRSRGLVDADLDRAVAAGSIIRTHVLRPTWHFVAREDLRWMLALTGPRVQKQNGPRYRELGLDERTLARCETVIASALEAGQLTRNEIAEALHNAGIDLAGQRLPYILMHCELEAVICSGGRVGKQHTYAILDQRVGKGRPFDRDEALGELTRRYLTSHGPATVQDLRWWSSLTVTDIKKALDMLGSDVKSETVDGLTLWSMAINEGQPSRVRGVHFLQAYDELIVGHTESRFLGDPRAEAVRASWRDRSLPTGIVLSDGRLAGHWRRTIEKNLVTVHLFLYSESRSRPRGLVPAAEELGRFLGREVTLEIRQI